MSFAPKFAETKTEDMTVEEKGDTNAENYESFKSDKEQQEDEDAGEGNWGHVIMPAPKKPKHEILQGKTPTRKFAP